MQFPSIQIEDMVEEIQYNEEYIDLRMRLIEALLIYMDSSILDISYSVGENELLIQVVHIESNLFDISDRVIQLQSSLPKLKISVSYLSLSSAEFNDGRFDYPPKSYKWLDTTFFTKSEAL